MVLNLNAIVTSFLVTGLTLVAAQDSANATVGSLVVSESEALEGVAKRQKKLKKELDRISSDLRFFTDDISSADVGVSYSYILSHAAKRAQLNLSLCQAMVSAGFGLAPLVEESQNQLSELLQVVEELNAVLKGDSSLRLTELKLWYDRYLGDHKSEPPKQLKGLLLAIKVQTEVVNAEYRIANMDLGESVRSLDTRQILELKKVQAAGESNRLLNIELLEEFVDFWNENRELIRRWSHWSEKLRFEINTKDLPSGFFVKMESLRVADLPPRPKSKSKYVKRTPIEEILNISEDDLKGLGPNRVVDQKVKGTGYNSVEALKIYLQTEVPKTVLQAEKQGIEVRATVVPSILMRDESGQKARDIILLRKAYARILWHGLAEDPDLALAMKYLKLEGNDKRWGVIQSKEFKHEGVEYIFHWKQINQKD